MLEINSERLSLAASMKDVDSATKRLDNIFMTLYLLVVLLIFAIMLVRILFCRIIDELGAQMEGLSFVTGRVNFFVDYWSRNIRPRLVLANRRHYGRRQVMNESPPKGNTDSFAQSSLASSSSLSRYIRAPFKILENLTCYPSSIPSISVTG